MSQDNVFLAGEGDAWYRRNRGKLAVRDDDPIFQFIKRFDIKGNSVLDIGCSDGWRLFWLWDHGRLVTGRGADPSFEAIMVANDLASMEKAPFNFWQAKASALPVGLWDVEFDLVMLIYTMHWWDRGSLLRGMAEVDRVLRPGGSLLIADFWPDGPRKVPYKHKEGLWTYKAQYPLMFMATGLYEQVGFQIYNHDTGECPEHGTEIPERQRAGCWLLRKEEQYCELE